VPATGALGGTNGVLNRVEVRGEPVGDVAFSGPGAGGDATSSAVIGDLLAIARHGGSTWAGLAPAEESPAGASLVDPYAAARPWFAFLPGIAPEGVELGKAAAIEEILGGTAFRTDPLTLEQVRAAIAPRLADGVDVTLYPVTD
jgi:hypothetical protein